MTDTSPAPSRVERIVVFNRYSWVEPNPHKPGEQLYLAADRGATIAVLPAEAERGEQLGALSTAEVLDSIAERRRALEAELAALTAQIADNRQQVAPAPVAPPPPAVSGVVLTPSMTGAPPEPLPDDAGPLAPATPSAVDAARAIAQQLAGEPLAEPTAAVGPSPASPLAAFGTTPPAAPIPPAGPAGPTPTTAAAPAAPATVNPATAQPAAPVTDADLNGYKVEQVLAYLNQHADEVDRIETLELARATPRKGVLDAVAAIRDHE